MNRDQINDLINKQAAGAKAGTNSQKVAALLLQAAQLLQGDQGNRVNFMQEIRERKAKQKASLDRFSKAASQFAKEKQMQPGNQAHEALAAAGWKRNGQNIAQKTTTYIHPDLPSHTMRLQDDTFTLLKADKPIIEKAPLAKLVDFLKQKKNMV